MSFESQFCLAVRMHSVLQITAQTEIKRLYAGEDMLGLNGWIGLIYKNVCLERIFPNRDVSVLQELSLKSFLMEPIDQTIII